MKEPKNFYDRPLEEVLDILNCPEKHKDITFKEFISIVSELGAVGKSIKDAMPSQINSCDVEDRFKKLETSVKALEDRLDSICRAFGGDYYD